MSYDENETLKGKFIEKTKIKAGFYNAHPRIGSKKRRIPHLSVIRMFHSIATKWYLP
ncbi:hypothetical protein [Azospirillum palustre]